IFEYSFCSYGSIFFFFFFFSSRRRHTRFDCDWSSDVCSSDLVPRHPPCALSSLTVKLTREQRRQFQISNLRSQISLSSRANLSVHLHSKTCLVFLCRYSIVKEPSEISNLKFEISYPTKRRNFNPQT